MNRETLQELQDRLGKAYITVTEIQDLITTVDQMWTKRDTLFDAVKHGDEQHQTWLKKAIVEHFQ